MNLAACLHSLQKNLANSKLLIASLIDLNHYRFRKRVELSHISSFWILVPCLSEIWVSSLTSSSPQDLWDPTGSLSIGGGGSLLHSQEGIWPKGNGGLCGCISALSALAELGFDHRKISFLPQQNFWWKFYGSLSQWIKLSIDKKSSSVCL